MRDEDWRGVSARRPVPAIHISFLSRSGPARHPLVSRHPTLIYSFRYLLTPSGYAHFPSGGSEIAWGSSRILTGGSDVIATVRDPRAPMTTRFGLGFVRGLPRGTHFLPDHMPVRVWVALSTIGL